MFAMAAPLPYPPLLVDMDDDCGDEIAAAPRALETSAPPALPLGWVFTPIPVDVGAVTASTVPSVAVLTVVAVPAGPIALALNASKVLLPVSAALMLPTIPCWQWLP